MTSHEKNLEALVYSENRSILARSCAAFAEMPLDWMAMDDSETAKHFLSKERFDLVLLDLDGPNALSLLEQVTLDRKRQGIVFAISGNPEDPSISQWCHEFQVVYPVRPDDIGRYLEQQELRCALQNDAEKSLAKVFGRVTASVRKLRDRLGKFSLREHSLSVIAQERLASAIAALGAIWFVNDLTTNFRGLTQIQPYSTYSIQLIALSVLLWLCAKQRRFSTLSVSGVSS